MQVWVPGAMPDSITRAAGDSLVEIRLAGRIAKRVVLDSLILEQRRNRRWPRLFQIQNRQSSFINRQSIKGGSSGLKGGRWTGEGRGLTNDE
jgi:hypothetical protein